MFIFLFAVSPTLIACSCAILYSRIRKGSGSGAFPWKQKNTVLLLCLAAELTIAFLISPANLSLCLIFWEIAAVLSGIDILIRKIPTELLAVYYLTFLLILLRYPFGISLIAAAVLFAFVFFVIRGRIGIALYDIFALIPLLVFSGSVIGQIKYIAVFLIGWGLFGLILHCVKKKEGPLTVPLVPIEVISFLLLRYFSLLLSHS